MSRRWIDDDERGDFDGMSWIILLAILGVASYVIWVTW